MNERRSGKPDEQAVIAAVQLLVQSMEPSQREQLLSTFVAYEVGLHAGAMGTAAQAFVCQGREYIVLEGRDAPFISYSDNQVIIGNDNRVQYVHLVRTGNYFAGPDIAWHSIESQDPQAAAQCMGGVRIMVLPLRH